MCLTANLVSDNYFPGCLSSFAARYMSQVEKARGPDLNEKVTNSVFKNTIFSLTNQEPSDVNITLKCEESSPFKISLGRVPDNLQFFKNKSFSVKRGKTMSFSIFFDTRPRPTDKSKIEIFVTRNSERTLLQFELTAVPPIMGYREAPFFCEPTREKPTENQWFNVVASPIITENEKANMRRGISAIFLKPILPALKNPVQIQVPLPVISSLLNPISLVAIPFITENTRMPTSLIFPERNRPRKVYVLEKALE